MASEWRDTTLGEFVRLQRGHDLTEVDRRPGTVPIMGSAGFSGFHDVAKAKGPGVVIGRSGVGSMGVATYCATDYWPHNTVLYVTDFLGNDELFTYYFLKHLNLRRFDSGSAQASLNRNYVYPIRIRVPYLDEQRAIAHILGMLDDKIDANRRMSETLEAMTRAVFQSWFVDFDPVRAKAEGRDPGLLQPLADIFPARLVDSELGDIPEGWGTVTIQDAFDILDGRTLPPERRSPHHPYDAFGANGVIGRTDEAWVDSPCIILGKIGSCGSLHRSSGPCWVTNNSFAIRGGNSGSLEFAWWSLLGIDFTQFVGGSANPYMPLKNFGHYVVVRPSPGVIAAFERWAGQLRLRMEHGKTESSALAILRDTLLPKLISGGLRVKDAERIVEIS